MPYPDPALRDRLLSAVGRRLTRALMEVFVRPDGQTSDHPMFVWPQFDGIELQRAYCRLGESVGIDAAPPDPKDMGTDGSTIVRDVSHEHPFGPCLRQVLADVAVVRERGHDDCGGFQWTFENGSTLVVLDIGDELRVASHVQSAAPAYEWQVKTLRST